MLARLALVAAVVVAIALALALYFSLTMPSHDGMGSSYANSTAQSQGSITIITISGNSILPGVQYNISPISSSNSAGFTVADGSARDSDPSDGILKINNLDNGNYSITQLSVPPGYAKDASPRFVHLDGKPLIVTFSASSQANVASQGTQPQRVTYTAKFECGTISGTEGPLRPGRYDTDISMFNKQDSAVKILWSASVVHGQVTNSIVQNLGSRQSSSIVCKDLTSLLGVTGKFSEGYVFIEVPLDAQTIGQLASNGSVVVGQQQNLTDILDVQAFYTANALDVLPHEIYVDKVSFTILNDTSGKLPPELLGKMLDVTVPSNVSSIQDPELQVKNVLASQYGLPSEVIKSLHIRINGIDVAVSATVDDHAISLSRIPPQPSS